MRPFKSAILLAGLMSLAAPALAQDVNVYSSRHYDSDDALYAAFTKETGIDVNRIEANSDELIARMEAEGANSPADVFITVDIGRMARAEKAGLLQPYNSDVIDARVPAHLRHPDGLWAGLSQRARIIFYAKDRVKNPPQTYEELADPKWKGTLCMRSSSNVYNQSLLASIIEVHGEKAAKDWAAGIVANMARPPQGGDIDQLRGLVSGECDVAVANHYYFVRGWATDVPGLSESMDKVGWVWPNQDGRGAHMNLTAAGMAAHAPDPENARKLLEWLTGPTAQKLLSHSNHEFAAVAGVEPDPYAQKLGDFKPDTTTPTSAFSRNAPKAQAIFNQVGWN